MKKPIANRVSVCRRVSLYIGVVVAVLAAVVYQLVFGMNNTSTSAWYYIATSLGLFQPYAPTVNTNLGSVRGIISNSRDGRPVYEYRGIPYAKPPIDDLRFEPPVPAEPWEGVLTADHTGPACLQFDAMVRGMLWGEEDCLRLNVFTPNVQPDKLYPVIAYIHGGGFTGGESTIFNPKYMMDHDVVVVTFNYRLASLGFLNTGDELIRGNMGLKDQNLALRWTRDNIKFFGGDPEQVTLMGESAGGASAHYHLISPLSRGLFQRAIIQSGNLGCPWSLTRNPQHQALRYGKILNCPVDNTSVLVDCLRKMDPRDIVKPHVAIMSPVHLQDDFFPGSVEAVQREDTFLSENPHIMVERGDFAHIPVMFGVTNGEGGLKLARLEAFPEVLDELDTKWNQHVACLMHYDPNRTDVSDKLRDYYFGSNKNDLVKRVNPADELLNLTKMLSAGIFFEGNHRVAKHHSKYAPTYLYYYTYISESLPGAFSIIRAARPKRHWWYPWEANIFQGVVTYYADKYIWRSKDPRKYGACHGDDIPQTFSMNTVFDVKPGSSDYAFSKELVKSIVQFVKNEPDLQFGNVLWPPVNSSDARPKHMRMDVNASIIEEPFTEEVKFIQSLNIRDPLDPSNW